MKKLTQAAKAIREEKARKRAEKKAAETPRNPFSLKTTEELLRLNLQFCTYFWNVSGLSAAEKVEWSSIRKALEEKGVVLETQIRKRG